MFIVLHDTYTAKRKPFYLADENKLKAQCTSAGFLNLCYSSTLMHYAFYAFYAINGLLGTFLTPLWISNFFK